MPWVEKGDSDEEFIDFIRNYNSDSRPAVLDLLQKYKSKSIFVFRSREDAEGYLNSLKNN